MCGIAGFTWRDERKSVEISTCLSHRGPDDGGSFADGNISLVHRRLSIIDLTDAGHQPMFYHPEKGVCSEKFRNELINNSLVGIVYNGEIYNFPELKEELKKKGYAFASHSDTELILAAYIEWGTACVEKFNGMWAFCIYDKRKQSLFLSRDRFGIKPLYYYHTVNRFAFASELKPFYKLGIPLEIEPDSLNHFFIFSHSPENQSLVKQIKKLESGNNLVYSLEEKEIIFHKKYWRPVFEENDIPVENAKINIYRLIGDSVKKRLLSDVEVGAFLSGGLDSSVVVYFMRQYQSNLKTFSIGFDYPDYNESAWARLVANKFQTDHYEIDFSANDIKKLIEELPYCYDEPFGDESMIPTYLVSKVAASHVKVALSGTGSDEIFAGYKRYNEYLVLVKLLKLNPLLKKILVQTYNLFNKDKSGKLFELLFSENSKELYFKLLSDLFRGNNSIEVDLTKIERLQMFFNQSSSLKNVLNFDQNHYLTEDLLVKEDRATMAHGLEGRIPFLDFRLVQYVNSLPDHYKLKGFKGKYILREIFRDKLPQEVLTRKKQGFGVPLKHYFRKELKTCCEELIFDFTPFKYYNKEKVKVMWKSHQEGKSDYSSFFWNLMIFNKWYESYR